jgi:hypothetical protein
MEWMNDYSSEPLFSIFSLVLSTFFLCSNNLFPFDGQEELSRGAQFFVNYPVFQTKVVSIDFLLQASRRPNVLQHSSIRRDLLLPRLNRVSLFAHLPL